MTVINVQTVSNGEEHTDSCKCCGRPIYQGCGELRTEGKTLVDYWYRWSEGHEGRFALAVCPRSDNGEPSVGVVVMSGWLDSEGIHYAVLEPNDSPWPAFGAFGPILSRKQALEGPIAQDLFGLVDAIVANERRLSSRILSCGLKA